MEPSEAAAVAVPGRTQSPSVAMVAGLVLPGAGQAYNGRPFRAAFVLLLSPMILPWFLASFFAASCARSINRDGGRYGKGCVVWLLLHAWLVANFALALLAGLTMWGVIR